MNVLILTSREQMGCDQIVEIGNEADILTLKGIAEEAEGVELDWLTYPPLPGSEFAISPLYPKKVYNILPWSLPGAGAVAFVGAKVYLTANQSVGSGTATQITLNASEYVEGVTFGSSKLTIVTAGYYSVKAVVGYATGGGLREAQIWLDGVPVAYGGYGHVNITQLATNNHAVAVWEGFAAAAAEFKLYGLHHSTGAVNALGGVTRTWMAINKIG